MRVLAVVLVVTCCLGAMQVPAAAQEEQSWCKGETPIRRGGTVVGCLVSSEGSLPLCQGTTVLRPTPPTGTCFVCLREKWVGVARECPEEFFTPGDFSCLTGTRAPVDGTKMRPPQGIIAWWPVDERSHGTVHELVGGHAGSHFNGPTLLPPRFPLGQLSADHGVIGGALSFDGRDDYVEVPVAGTDLARPAGTVEGWINTSQMGGAPSILDNRSEPYSGYNVYLYRGSLGLQLASGGKYTNYNSQALVADGKWHHFAVSYGQLPSTGGPPPPVQIFFYVDGDLKDIQKARKLLPGMNTGVARMGARSVDSGGFFHGALDELTVYGDTLAPAQIERLARFRGGKCRAALDVQ